MRKKIHQIFWNIQGKELNEFPLFERSIKSIKEKNPDAEHILWSKEGCQNVIEKRLPEHLYFYNNLKYDIQRLDFIRAVILYCEGGIYVDLDLICLKNIDKLFEHKFFIHSHRHIKPKSNEYVCNDLMGSEKGFRFWKILMDESKENYAKDKSVSKLESKICFADNRSEICRENIKKGITRIQTALSCLYGHRKRNPERMEI